MTVPSPTRLRHVMLAAGIGSALEWYDFFIYGMASALVFGQLFFPKYDPTVATLASFATFAVGFLARPFGGLFFGHFGDKWGRKPMLGATLLLVGGSTFAIGLLPTYAQVGIWAPILLLVLRLLQGFGAGAEYGGAVIMAVEFAPEGRRGLYGAFAPMGTTAGNALAGLTFWLVGFLAKDELLTWGWRSPFALGAVLALVVFRIRRGLAETASYATAQAAGAPRSGLFMLFRQHPREAFLVMAMTAGGTLAFYAYSIYMQKFLVNTSGFSRETASTINALTLLGFMLLQPLAGALSDRIGRRPLLIGFGLAGTLGTWPIFTTLAQTKDPLVAGLVVMAALVIVTGYTAINAVVKAELFPAHVRALGVALPYALANTLFGGTAEYVALRFKAAGWEQGFYLYVTALCALSLVTYLTMRETRDASLIAED